MACDLKNRLVDFSITIINFAKKLPNNLENKIISKQLIRSATSIGANYHEAQRSQSRRAFCQKVSISLKEANETIYWLEILSKLHPDDGRINQEALEVVKILTTISKKSRQSPPNP